MNDDDDDDYRDEPDALPPEDVTIAAIRTIQRYVDVGNTLEKYRVRIAAQNDDLRELRRQVKAHAQASKLAHQRATRYATCLAAVNPNAECDDVEYLFALANGCRGTSSNDDPTVLGDWRLDDVASTSRRAPCRRASRCRCADG